MVCIISLHFLIPEKLHYLGNLIRISCVIGVQERILWCS